LIFNGVYSNNILGFTYGEGKLFVVIQTAGGYFIRPTKTAKEIYDGEFIGAHTSTFTDSFLDIKFFKNKVYLLSSNGGNRLIRIYEVSYTGNLVTPPSVISNSEMSDGLKMDIFEDRIYIYKDDNQKTIVSHDLSGGDVYFISSGIKAKNHIVHKNKIFITDENSSNIYLYILIFL
jgi:hypothetical protein